VEAIGIRELRQRASEIIDAAKNGTSYRVTNRGADTGVSIGVQPQDQHHLAEQRAGARPEQVINSGVYDSPKPPGYEEEMLRLVERGRDESGRVGGS
jgi:prevent-host-death family protein